MKTKQEILEQLEIYKKIKAKSSIFAPELMLSSGAITALEWVLEIERDNNVKRNN